MPPDLNKHRLEEVEGLELIFKERIFLSYRSQADPPSQFIHGKQMLFPFGIKDLQENIAEDLLRQFGAELVYLLAEPRPYLFEDNKFGLLKILFCLYVFNVL